MKTIRLIILLLLPAVLITACTSSNKYYIDNPSNAELLISIDGGEQVKVAALEYKQLPNLKPGEHTFTVNGSQPLTITVDEGTGFINATQATYIIFKQEYSDLEVSTLPTNTIELGEELYTGPFSIENGLYINTSSYDLSVLEPFTEEISVPESETKKIITKVFRESDFITYVK